MRIVIPGIDASQSGLGRSLPLVRGLPADGLQALYLFDNGQVGQPVNQFVDLSGKRNHGHLYGNYAAPVQRTWGVEVQSVNGLMIATGVPVGQSATVVLALEARVPGNESGVFPTHFGTTANAYNIDPAAYVANANTPVVNFSGAGAFGSYALFDGTTGTSVLGATRTALVGGPGNSQPAVLGLRINGPANTMGLRANSGAEQVVSRASIGSHYAQDRGEILLGAWGQGSQRTAASPNYRLFGAAVYDRVLDDEMLSVAMRGIRRQAEAAGIVFA